MTFFAILRHIYCPGQFAHGNVLDCCPGSTLLLHKLLGHLETSLSSLKGKLADGGEYLYQMPPTKWNSNLFITWDHWGKLTEWTFNIGTNTSFEQHQVASNEMETPGYTLVHLGLDTHYRKMEFFLNANNLLDHKYLDHMSRFRSYEIYSPGRNISLGIKMPLL